MLIRACIPSGVEARECAVRREAACANRGGSMGLPLRKLEGEDRRSIPQEECHLEGLSRRALCSPLFCGVVLCGVGLCCVVLCCDLSDESEPGERIDELRGLWRMAALDRVGCAAHPASISFHSITAIFSPVPARGIRGISAAEIPILACTRIRL